MKVVVFGATGSVGKHAVEQAVEQGHDVTCFVRESSKGSFANNRVNLAVGDVFDYSSVESAVEGADAVISTIGAPVLTRSKVRSQGTQNIVRAMEATAVHKLISLSSMGIGNSRPMLPRLYKYVLVPLILRQGFQEHERQEEFVQKSSIDWVIVRPGAYTDGPLTEAYRHGLPNGRVKTQAKISRADVANFMVAQISSDKYVRQSPWISY